MYQLITVTCGILIVIQYFEIIYGDEEVHPIQMKINNDHAQNDIMYQIF